MKKKSGIGFMFAFLLLLLSLYVVPKMVMSNVQPMMNIQSTQGHASQGYVSPDYALPGYGSKAMAQATAQIPSEIQVIVAQDYTDTLKNVYAPPVRYRETEYRQLGYLTAPNRDRLPLFGRVLNRRDKWTYYTLEQGIKLPIEYNRRLCTQSPGCDSLSSGDEVMVEGSPYKVNLYESFLASY
jgi:hypothetical protein